jgi:hypothetical protein
MTFSQRMDFQSDYCIQKEYLFNQRVAEFLGKVFCPNGSESF